MQIFTSSYTGDPDDDQARQRHRCRVINEAIGRQVRASAKVPAPTFMTNITPLHLGRSSAGKSQLFRPMNARAAFPTGMVAGNFIAVDRSSLEDLMACIELRQSSRTGVRPPR